ncbi:MAG: nickel-dependent lactate racemase [Pirellulales bacterium]|nr:nickel-dependent lactate racemase [Pirellulales bacterium]
MSLATQQSISLPWGDGQLEVRLPASWQVVGRFEPREMAAAADPLVACREALQAPVGAAPWSGRDLRGKRVLLVPDDVSRPTPVADFAPAVCEALHAAGVAAGDLEILFALGVHRPMTQAEAEAKFGRDLLARYCWHNHNAFEPAQLVHLGTTRRGTPVWFNRLLTEFDLIVPLGAIEPHLLLGFSGGYKMLLPGCAGAETIGHNHLQGTGGGSFNYVGVLPDDSPMRLDIEEAASMLGREVFVVNAALRADKRVVRFFCGCPRGALRAGVAYVREHAEVQVPQPVDVVIANSAPFDIDLRQSMKCIGNTSFAARRGGVVLGFLRCDEGRGDVEVPSRTLPYGALKLVTGVLGSKRIMNFVNLVRRGDPVEQKFLSHFALQTLHRNEIYVYSEQLEPDVGRKLGILRQYRDPDAMVAEALRKVGPRATVAVFPQGGCTYTRGSAFASSAGTMPVAAAS